MPRKPYDWSKNSYPPIEPHSLVKHEVLREYLFDYLKVRTANPRQERMRLTIVDGFAGGGLYRLPNGSLHEGSPLILLRTVEEFRLFLKRDSQRRPGFALDVHFHFVEKDAGAMGSLKAAIVERQLDHVPNVFYHQAPFDSTLAAIRSSILSISPKVGTSLFVLDQYGYTDVLPERIRELFSQLKKAEFLVTLAAGSAFDYLPTATRSSENVRRLGVDLSKVIEDGEVNADWKNLAYRLLLSEFPRLCGAQYYTNFFIVPQTSNKSLLLIHLSQHRKARDVMANVHWAKANTSRHYGIHGAESAELAHQRQASALHKVFVQGYDPDFADPRLALPLISFDQHDKRRSIAELADGFAKRVASQQGAPTVGWFLNQGAKDSIATEEMIRQAIVQARDRGELEIVRADGKPFRGNQGIDDDFVLRIPNQMRLFSVGRGR